MYDRHGEAARLPLLPLQTGRVRTVAAFFGLTLAWSWCCYLPGLTRPGGLNPALATLAALGPAVAAVAVTLVESGPRRAWQAVRAAGWTAPARALGVALLAPPALWVVALAAWSRATGLPMPALADVDWLAVPAVFFAFAVASSLWEEVGWRWFAFARLEPRLGALRASLLVGVAWAVWHLPLFVVDGAAQEGGSLVAFTTFVMAASILFGRAWTAGGGRLAVVWMLHASLDTCHAVLGEVVPAMASADLFDRLLAAAAGLAAVGAVMVERWQRARTPVTVAGARHAC